MTRAKWLRILVMLQRLPDQYFVEVSQGTRVFHVVQSTIPVQSGNEVQPSSVARARSQHIPDYVSQARSQVVAIRVSIVLSSASIGILHKCRIGGVFEIGSRDMQSQSNLGHPLGTCRTSTGGCSPRGQSNGSHVAIIEDCGEVC